MHRLTRAQIYQLGNNWQDGGQAAWGQFASELKSLPHRSKYRSQHFVRYRLYMLTSVQISSIDCVIMGMTQYNPNTGKCAAHTALGGGQMALFGSGGLHTWPCTLGEVRACWMDSTKVDKSRNFDDSGGRGITHCNLCN